jgi:hypothetical protein
LPPLQGPGTVLEHLARQRAARTMAVRLTAHVTTAGSKVGKCCSKCCTIS